MSLEDSHRIDFGSRAGGGGEPVLSPNLPTQACAACETLVDITDKEPLERSRCPNCEAELIVQAQIDHYQILRVAGRGGMGVVFEAYDPGLDRRIALKVLRKDHGNLTSLIEKLENEAAVTAAVNH